MNQHPYFLERVARRVIASMKDHKNVAIILPNKRPAIYIKKYMAQQITSPIFLPKILTIEEFFFQVTGLLKADYTQQLILLHEAYRKANIGSDTIEELLGWAPTFISDCNDIDNSLAEANYFFQVLLEEKELRNWNLGEDLTTMQESYLSFWREAPQLYHTFTRLLLDNKASYSGLSYRIGVQQLEEKWDVPYDKLLFVGFNALNNAEEKLIDLALQHQCGELLWDMDGYYLNDRLLKAGDYFRKYIDKWKFNANIDTITGYQNEAINIIKAPNTVGQTDVVYNIVKKTCADKTPVQLRSTAIILCDETLLEPTLLRLPDAYTYNITMGKPLKSFGQFHLFDNLFNIYQDKRAKGFTADSLTNLINSPYIGILDTSKTGNVIQQFIIQNNQYYIAQEEVNELIKSDKNIWSYILNCPAEPIKILELGLHIINRLRAYYLDHKDRGNIEVIYEFRNLLVNLINIGQAYPEVLTLRTLRRLYQKVVGQAKIPYEGEPVEGIQIMGLLESRTLDFEHIILVSTNEGILPESKNAQSFIPYMFKTHFNMPTYNERDAIFAYSFYRLLHHTKRMDIVYSDSTGSLSGGELSRYVKQVIAEYNVKAHKPTKIRMFDAVFQDKKGVDFEYVIPKTEQIIDEIKYFIENVTFSASSLNTLIASPLDFYMEKIARVKEPTKLETSMQSNTLGTIIHEVLENLYTPYVGMELTEEICLEIEQKMSEELSAKTIEHFKGGDTSRGHNYLMSEAAKVMTKEAINFDKKRIKNGDKITIVSLEEELLSNLELMVNGQSLVIKLRGYADRIQRVNNIIEIIDYKSGTVKSISSTKIAQLTEDGHDEKLLQLLTYCHMVTNRTNEGKQSYDLSIVRPALQPLKSWQNGLVYIKDRQSEIIEILPEHLDVYKEKLSLVFEQLLDVNVPFAPVTDEKKTVFSKYKSVWS